jgi:hypothetical protein
MRPTYFSSLKVCFTEHLAQRPLESTTLRHSGQIICPRSHDTTDLRAHTAEISHWSPVLSREFGLAGQVTSEQVFLLARQMHPRHSARLTNGLSSVALARFFPTGDALPFLDEARGSCLRAQRPRFSSDGEVYQSSQATMEKSRPRSLGHCTF